MLITSEFLNCRIAVAEYEPALCYLTHVAPGMAVGGKAYVSSWSTTGRQKQWVTNPRGLGDWGRLVLNKYLNITVCGHSFDRSVLDLKKQVFSVGCTGAARCGAVTTSRGGHNASSCLHTFGPRHRDSFTDSRKRC